MLVKMTKPTSYEYAIKKHLNKFFRKNQIIAYQLEKKKKN